MKSTLSKKKRIGILISAVWLIIIFIASINKSYGRIDEDFFTVFLIFGVLPLLIGWGIRWIKQNGSEKKPSGHPDTATSISSAPARADESKRIRPWVRPWVRYWARTFDLCIFSLVVGFMHSIINPYFRIPGYFLLMISGIAWILVEAMFLSYFQTTPGKSLLKTKIAFASGKPIGFWQALSRSLKVWWLGLGMGFPLVTLITQIVAYVQLTKNGATSWDKEGGFTVTHETIGALRVLLAVVAFFLISFIMLTIFDWSL